MKTFEVAVTTIEKKNFYSIDEVDTSIEYYGGMPIILKPEVMFEVYSKLYQDPAYQMVVCTGGNGAYPDHSGTGVFFTEADGQTNKWDRYSVLGVPTKEALQDYIDRYGSYITSPSVLEVFKNYINS